MTQQLIVALLDPFLHVQVDFDPLGDVANFPLAFERTEDYWERVIGSAWKGCNLTKINYWF